MTLILPFNSEVVVNLTTMQVINKMTFVILQIQDNKYKRFKMRCTPRQVAYLTDFVLTLNIFNVIITMGSS